MMEKIIEPISYKKMVESYTHPVHVYGKKINLKEGVGAGYTLTFLGIKLTNVKVEEPQKDRDGFYTVKFTADIKPGEYHFFADHPYWALGSLLPDMSGTRESRGWNKYFVGVGRCFDEAVITGGKVEGVCDDGGQRFTSWNSDDNGPGWTEEDYIREIESEEFILGDIYGGGWAHSPMKTEIEFEYSEGNSYFHAIDQTEGNYNDATILKATFNFDPGWVADYNDAVDRAIYGEEEEEVKYRITGIDWDVDDEDDLAELPEEAVVVLEDGGDEDDAIDQLSDDYGFLVNGVESIERVYESKMREYSSSRSIKNYKPRHDFKKTKKYQDDEGLVGDIVKIIGTECLNSALPIIPKFFGQFRKPKYDFSKRPDFKDYKKKDLEQEFSDFKNALGHKGEIVKTLPENNHVKKSFIIRVLDGPSKDKEFEFYPGEFYVIKGRLDNKYRFRNYEESKKSKKLSERTHRIEHEGHVIGYAEPGEDEYLFYSNGKSATRFIGFISADDGKVYLKGHLAKEVYEAFPDYIELKKHDNLKESLDDDDWEDDREDYEGTVSNDLAEMRYLVDKEKSGMSLDSYELRVLQSLIRDYPDEYEEYLNNDYVDPEDYDKEGTYDEYLRYCAVTDGDPMSEEEWRQTTGIYESKESSESKLEEDALSSKIRQSVIEVNAAKQKVDQDVDVLDRVVNKASQDMMRAAINHGKTSQMTESGTSFVHKSIKIDFPLDFDEKECVREEDARRLLRKIAAERKLRVNTEYKIEDSYGYTSTWEFNETDDPGFRYVFSCKDGDYSCYLYLNKRRNKVDLKNSKFVRGIDREEGILVESKLNEAARYTHRIELAQDDPSVPLRTRITNADQLRYRSQEEAEKALNDLNKRWSNGLSSRGLHLEIHEIPQKPRRVASQVEGYENPFEVGDILEGDFGYSMILPVWYEVVKVTSKQVTLKELSSIVVSHDGYGQAGVKKPNIGVYKKNWEGKEREIRALVKKHGGSYYDKYDNPKKKYYVTVDNHILDLWDGENKSFDTYD